MIDYAGNKVDVNGCYGCVYAQHEFEIPTGISYEDDLFTLSQDWELPIQGFFVVSPKRHIENFSELTDEERKKIFDIANYAILTLKKNNICEHFNVIFEEKPKRHFHIWIMPRHKWMNEMAGNIIGNIGKIFDYAVTNLKTQNNLDRIKEISKLMREAFLDYKY